MRARTRLLLAGALLLGVPLAAVLSLPPADAARNSSGTYTLPAGNPVIAGTPISSSWANSTLADIAQGVTDSLDRQGRGGMSAPLKLVDGNAAAPALAFNSDTNTGLYRPGADALTLTLGGSMAQAWTTAGTTFAADAGVSGSLSVGAGLTVTGATVTTGDLTTGGILTAGTTVIVDNANANNGVPSANWLQFGVAGSGEGIASRRIAGTGQNGLDFYTQGQSRMSISNAGGLRIPGAFAASPGTPITGSYAAGYNIDFPSANAGQCATPSVQVLTGVVVGGACTVSTTEVLNLAAVISCSVTGTNSITISLCNGTPAPIDAGAINFQVRVWNP